MATETKLQHDPLDTPKQKKGEKLTGPLHTPPPIEDPGEADREKLLREAETDVERGGKLPPH